MSDDAGVDERVDEINDDFGLELDDMGEQDWRENDPGAPEPE